MKMGATKKDFDETVGIYLMVFEEFMIFEIMKCSGIDFIKKGC